MKQWLLFPASQRFWHANRDIETPNGPRDSREPGGSHAWPWADVGNGASFHSLLLSSFHVAGRTLGLALPWARFGGMARAPPPVAIRGSWGLSRSWSSRAGVRSRSAGVGSARAALSDLSQADLGSFTEFGLSMGLSRTPRAQESCSGFNYITMNVLTTIAVTGSRWHSCNPHHGHPAERPCKQLHPRPGSCAGVITACSPTRCKLLGKMVVNTWPASRMGLMLIFHSEQEDKRHKDIGRVYRHTCVSVFARYNVLIENLSWWRGRAGSWQGCVRHAACSVWRAGEGTKRVLYCAKECVVVSSSPRSR